MVHGTHAIQQQRGGVRSSPPSSEHPLTPTLPRALRSTTRRNSSPIDASPTGREAQLEEERVWRTLPDVGRTPKPCASYSRPDDSIRSAAMALAIARVACVSYERRLASRTADARPPPLDSESVDDSRLPPSLAPSSCCPPRARHAVRAPDGSAHTLRVRFEPVLSQGTCPSRGSYDVCVYFSRFIPRLRVPLAFHATSACTSRGSGDYVRLVTRAFC